MVDEDGKPTPGQVPGADRPELTAPSLAPGEVAPVVDPSPRFYRDWRGGVTVACILSLAAGIWLIVSSLVLDYVAGDSRLIPTIAGAVVACVALVRMATGRAEWLALINVVAGLVLLPAASRSRHPRRPRGTPGSWEWR
jgi:hypothetical protein